MKNPIVRLSEDQLRGHIEGGIENLNHLAQIYDGGHSYIAFSMATEVRRVLDASRVAVRLRGEKKFPTVQWEDNPRNLAADHKLVIAHATTNPPGVKFLPYFQEAIFEPAALRFKDWWNNDIIFRAAATAPGDPPGTIPIDPSRRVPWTKRKVLNRRTFVDMVRNKFGAHLDEEIPQVLDDLLKSNDFGADIVVDTPGGRLMISDGTLPVSTPIAAAMMRQIAQETLVAYGSIEIWGGAPSPWGKR